LILKFVIEFSTSGRLARHLIDPTIGVDHAVEPLTSEPASRAKPGALF
jgi:hypothetical protein